MRENQGALGEIDAPRRPGHDATRTQTCKSYQSCLKNRPAGKEGDAAPLFTAATNGAGTVALAHLRGRSVVLYFYPRDNTPGCTIEACAFRDQFSDFQSRNIAVLAVSADSVKSHDQFAQKFRLPFVLLADEDKAIARAYGAWGEKSFLGRKYMGLHRITFLIGPDGRIVRIWRKVKPLAHAAEVLAAAGTKV